MLKSLIYRDKEGNALKNEINLLRKKNISSPWFNENFPR